ncbi:hypothetical protein OIU77_010891 [Salix suchowensis]|uniref:Protein kinase domain-containing protein n=1 Tax=Salix suchowensis TaxID=1278906 RepID=A0ABQ9AAD2_9ROSI|nr:hypothetical protein OIU77_010891 [Salix suchowensis]
MVAAAAAAAWFLFVGGLAVAFSAEALSFNNSASGALLSFKNSIFGDPSNLLSSWNLTTSPDNCTWYGVTCQKSSNTTRGVVVIALNLTGTSTARLSGTLPESIQNLPYLRTLVLSHNSFSGEIPAGSIAKLSFLEVLELQGNNFSGKIPQQISTDLHYLRFLNLSFNSFTGDIPATLIGFGKLRAIDLSNNRLTGEMQLVSSSKCLFLRHLKLSNNLLENNIPKDIGHCKNLRTLLLDGNILQGPIPAEIGQILELRVLDVSTNSLTQTIPKELGYCKKLSVLEVAMLPSLQILWAPRANLDGRLPGNWSDSCSLRVLHLGQNSLRGVVPKGLVMCKNLTFLDLSSNFLTGDLPMQLQIPCMMYFNVSQNNISGPVPTFGKGSCDTSIISYGQDPNFLDVEDIQIACSHIPVWGSHTLLGSMAGADFVIVHDFSWNHFVGSLPLFSVGEELLVRKNRTSYRLLLSSNGFTGSLPGKLVSNCNDLLSFSVNLSTNHISGEIPDMLLNCLPIREFEAADNEISGFLAPKGMLFWISAQINPPTHQPGEVQPSHGDGKWRNHRKRSFLIAAVTSASAVLCVSLVVVLLCFYGKRKFWRISSLRGKVVVTFADAPAELTYDSVVRATGNFSIGNLIEIRTLGRIRHKNLVTLIGYYVAEAEMFLIYNYLSGGNLETFIHDRPDTSVQWPYGNGFNIVAWAKLLIKERRSSELFAPELWEAGPNENLLGMLKLASSCTVDSLSVRPSMKQDLEKLKQQFLKGSQASNTGGRWVDISAAYT